MVFALDDVHWMDEMSWKVVQAIFVRGRNVLTLIGSRPPSANPLLVDKSFWSELQSTYRDDGRFQEISLEPFNELEVQEMISLQLDIRIDEIDSSFWKNVFTTSGGMPHYLSYALETIKRNDLTVRLDNGLIGLKSSEDDDNKVCLMAFDSYTLSFDLHHSDPRWPYWSCFDVYSKCCSLDLAL